MYQVVVAAGPATRLKLASFSVKQEAVDYASASRQDMMYEVVDDRTGLLKTIVTDGGVQHVLTPTRRDIA